MNNIPVGFTEGVICESQKHAEAFAEACFVERLPVNQILPAAFAAGISIGSALSMYAPEFLAKHAAHFHAPDTDMDHLRGIVLELVEHIEAHLSGATHHG